MKSEAKKKTEFWFLTGSQNLYGAETLRQVGEDAKQLVAGLNGGKQLPYKVVYKPVVTTPEAIREICAEANVAAGCAGVVTWMHTFSPSKMWIGGLLSLRKPLLHLHTQFGRDLPWGTIDMDFMNLHQSAHGDREHGFIHARLRLPRKVVVGHWEDPEAQERVGAWMRAAAAWQDWQGAKYGRFGDNMRQVAVTDGDKVAAEARFGFAVDTYGVGDLVEMVEAATVAEVDELVERYREDYEVASELLPGGNRAGSLREAARIEAGLRAFLEAGGCRGFTTSFEVLHGLKQLPGLAVQRLMAEGYGFGAEGDWKTAALVRAMKVMGKGLAGGTTFMEDYTYHLEPGRHLVLGAHMLEICPSVAAGKPRVEVHPLGIGGKADPVRLVFDACPGRAVNATLVDLGNRFRMIVQTVRGIEPPEALPKLPVARAVWEAEPDFKTACGCWILAGGAHHTGYSLAVTPEMLEDFCELAGIECLLIDGETRVGDFKKEMRTNEVFFLNRVGY